MTNEEAIKVLEPFKACMFDQYGCPISDAAIALDVAIEALKQTAWIPCSERLPEEGGHYICTCKDGIRTMVTYVNWQGKLKRWDLTGTRSYWRVIAWRPLPKSYEGEEE